MKPKRGLCQSDPHQFLRDVLQWSYDAVIIADGQRKILYANPAVCEKTGYSKAELIGAKVPLLYQKENSAKYTAKIFKDLYDQGRWTGQLEVRKKDGTTFTTDTVILAYADEHGKLAGTIGIGRDLSEGRLLKLHSMQSESRLQTIIDSMSDALCVCDRKGRIVMCNRAQATMLGYRVEEIIGVNPPYPWIDPLGQKKMEVGLRILLKEGCLKNYTVTWRSRNGKTLVASLAISMLSDGDNAASGYVISARDISDVQYVEELRRTNERIHRLIADVQRKAERLRVLEETNRLVLSHANARSIYKAIIGSIKKLLDHDLAAVYVYDARVDGFVAHTISKTSAFSRKLSKFPLKLGEGIIGRAARLGKMVWVNNAHLDPRSRYPKGLRPETEHFIAVPLKSNGPMFGILVVARNRDPLFIEEEAAVVRSFADAATVALENDRLLRELRKDHRNLSNEILIDGEHFPSVRI